MLNPELVNAARRYLVISRERVPFRLSMGTESFTSFSFTSSTFHLGNGGGTSSGTPPTRTPQSNPLDLPLTDPAPEPNTTPAPGTGTGGTTQTTTQS